MQGAAQPAGQAGQPVDAEHFDRLQHDASTASNLLSHFDDWEAIVQQAGLAGSGGGREAANSSSGATVVNADVIREAVQDFLQRQAPASSTQTMLNGSAQVSPVRQRCCCCNLSCLALTKGKWWCGGQLLYNLLEAGALHHCVG